MPRNGAGQAVGASPLMSRQGLAMASNLPRQGVGKVGPSQGALDARARARLGSAGPAASPEGKAAGLPGRVSV